MEKLGVENVMNIKHNYIEAGSGEPLILLHGNGENSAYFEHQIAYFQKYYRVIALDTRGHGKTERGTASFTIAQFADDLHRFMQDKKIEKANIFGFSDGGNIALVFSLKYPKCVDKLILNGANLYSSGVKPTVQIPIIIGYKIASLFAGKSPEAKKNAEMLGLMVNDPNLTPEEISQIKNRTLVIAGTKDMIKTKHSRLIADSLPNSKLVFIPGNHFIANKKPEQFNMEVERFLKEK